MLTLPGERTNHLAPLQGQMVRNDKGVAFEGTALPICRCHVRLGVRARAVPGLRVQQ